MKPPPSATPNENYARMHLQIVPLLRPRRARHSFHVHFVKVQLATPKFSRQPPGPPFLVTVAATVCEDRRRVGVFTSHRGACETAKSRKCESERV